jgi:NAD+ diphosphatase
MSYPEAVNLPFNDTILGGDFIPHRPGNVEPSEPGYWVILQGNALVVKEEGGRLSLWEGGLPDGLLAETRPFCIGRWQKRPLWAARISGRAELPAPFVAEPFNAVQERLDDLLLTLGGVAAQILHWDRNSALCSRCGGETELLADSLGKRCRSCGYSHFPSIHPCIIVLVKRGDEFLLVHKPEWNKGRYSLVAGFVDVGECLEECVRREVREETGIEVKNIRYVGSQNWPFPSQLMAGFLADYAAGEIKVDPAELEDARWFCREAMPEELPGRRSIARWIIDKYALGKT